MRRREPRTRRYVRCSTARGSTPASASRYDAATRGAALAKRIITPAEVAFRIRPARTTHGFLLREVAYAHRHAAYRYYSGHTKPQRDPSNREKRRVDRYDRRCLSRFSIGIAVGWVAKTMTRSQF